MSDVGAPFPAVGSVVDGRFRLLRSLGEQSGGEDFLAETDDGNQVVLKLLRGAELGDRERFDRELEAASNLCGAHVVPIVCCVARPMA